MPPDQHGVASHRRHARHVQRGRVGAEAGTLHRPHHSIAPPRLLENGADLARHSPLAVFCKRAFDLIAAGIFLVLFLPVYVALAVGVLLSSPGPVVFSQKRVGRGGKLFEFYKFRSMLVDSEEVLSSFLEEDEEARALWNEYQKLQDDPRVSGFGRFIRRFSLDELPQIWNVLKGDMSLVGPRPCLPAQKDFYGGCWQAYCAMKPGLTGLWQVSGRNSLSYQQRVEMDAVYVREWSLMLDAKILLKTFSVVLTGHGSA
jgi:exopolysaccharide production protein ExoY